MSLLKKKSNENSLEIEEDLEHYLAELEEIDRMKRESRMIDPNRMAKSFEEERKSSLIFKDEPHPSSPSRKSSKVSSNKDMIDVIEEIEDEENFIDSDDSFTKEFY